MDATIVKFLRKENEELREIIAEKNEIIVGFKSAVEQYSAQNEVVSESFQKEIDDLKEENQKLSVLIQSKVLDFLDKQNSEIEREKQEKEFHQTNVRNCVKAVSLESEKLSRHLIYFRKKAENSERNSKQKLVQCKQELKLLKQAPKEDELKSKIIQLEENLRKTKHELNLATKSNFDQFVLFSDMEKNLELSNSSLAYSASQMAILKSSLEQANFDINAEKECNKHLSMQIETYHKREKETESLLIDLEMQISGLKKRVPTVVEQVFKKRKTETLNRKIPEIKPVAPIGDCVKNQLEGVPLRQAGIQGVKPFNRIQPSLAVPVSQPDLFFGYHSTHPTNVYWF